MGMGRGVSLHGTDRRRRGVDVIGASIGLLASAPVVVGAALLVRARLGAPVWFRQRRVGFEQRPLTVWKLRTLGGRASRVGPVLRRLGVDELPQLVAVLRGEMALVGPRPLVPEELLEFTPAERAERASVRPGLTGWAQIHGRDRLEPRAKLALDLWYVRHRSARLDARILARTAAQWLRGDLGGVARLAVPPGSEYDRGHEGPP